MTNNLAQAAAALGGSRPPLRRDLLHDRAAVAAQVVSFRTAHHAPGASRPLALTDLDRRNK